MSAFDDEFGLFGDEEGVEEERKSTLGARKIATGETIIDEIEPEDERPARRRPGPPGDRSGTGDDGGGSRFPRRRPREVERKPLPDEIAHPRAVELLTFLAKRLVGNPNAVAVELHPDPRGAVLELEVDPDDLGKVIGRGGRVAQALRTIVRAGAEGRVTIDIVDSGEDDEDDEAVDALAQASVAVAEPIEVEDVVADAVSEDDDASEPVSAKPKKKAPAKKKTAAKPAVKAKAKAKPKASKDAAASD
jgi:predicted RNA-binding protein YlqC (UPF0109 family)